MLEPSIVRLVRTPALDTIPLLRLDATTLSRKSATIGTEVAIKRDACRVESQLDLAEGDPHVAARRGGVFMPRGRCLRTLSFVEALHLKRRHSLNGRPETLADIAAPDISCVHILLNTLSIIKSSGGQLIEPSTHLMQVA